MWAHVRRYGFILLLWGFTAAITAITWMFAEAAYNVYRARSWNAVECRILESDIQYNSGNSRIHVVFAYTVAGVEYRSSNYEFTKVYSTPRKSVSDALQPGKLTTCYVDPADPTHAVIERGLTFNMLGGVIALPFFLLLGLVSLGGVFEILGDIRRALWPAPPQHDAPKSDEPQAHVTQPTTPTQPL